MVALGDQATDHDSIDDCTLRPPTALPTLSSDPTTSPTASPTLTMAPSISLIPTSSPTFEPTPMCSPGTFLNVSTHECDQCAKGRMSAGGVGATCTPCPAGQVPNTAQSECVACQAGSETNGDGTACASCSPGRYSDGGVRVMGCVDCEVGQPYTTTVVHMNRQK